MINDKDLLKDAVLLRLNEILILRKREKKYERN